MSRILGLFPSALIAARGGMSANGWYNELRSQGIAPRKVEAQRLFKIAKDITTRAGSEPFAPLDETPVGADVGRWPTKTATGIVQTVALTYRDQTTGQIATTWYRAKSATGMTRQAAIAMAINAYASHTEEYGQDLIGAVHTSAYELVPFSEQ